MVEGRWFFILLPGICLINDNDHITIHAYPHNHKLDFRLYGKSFKNYCPECENNNCLDFKNEEEGDEEIFFDPCRAIICDKCKSEYDGVEGYKLKGSFEILTPVPGVKNNNPPAPALNY